MLRWDLSVWLSYTLLFLGLLELTKADYYIDDTNSTILYTQAVGSGLWYKSSQSNPAQIVYAGNNSLETIDYSRLYYNTL